MLRYSKFFVNSVLFLTTPSVVLYPQSHTQQITSQVQKVNLKEKQIAGDYFLSYDEILSLLDEIESGELERKCTSEQQIKKITHFVAFLAKEGVLPDNSPESLSLDDDIADLLNGEDNLYKDVISFVTSGEYRYMIVPTVLNGCGEDVLCKSLVKKQWNHVKKFTKRHKKSLIIGAAVVVAAAVVVVTLAAASSGVAATAPVSSKFDKKEQKEKSTPSIPRDVSSGMTATQDAEH